MCGLNSFLSNKWSLVLMKRENLEYIVDQIMQSRGVSLPPVNKGK